MTRQKRLAAAGVFLLLALSWIMRFLGGNQ